MSHGIPSNWNTLSCFVKHLSSPSVVFYLSPGAVVTFWLPFPLFRPLPLLRPDVRTWCIHACQSDGKAVQHKWRSGVQLGLYSPELHVQSQVTKGSQGRQRKR